MIGSRKSALRKAILTARSQLAAEERSVRSAAIAARVTELEVFARARTLALYIPIGAEVDPMDIARAAMERGKHLVFPRMQPHQRALGFAGCTEAALVAGRHGTREPPPSAPAVALERIDLVLVPGVALDLDGHRMGRGRGYYDATLAALSPRTARLGLAFELQIVPAVPREAHDAPLEAVVTEARVIAPSRHPAAGGGREAFER